MQAVSGTGDPNAQHMTLCSSGGPFIHLGTRESCRSGPDRPCPHRVIGPDPVQYPAPQVDRSLYQSRASMHDVVSSEDAGILTTPLLTTHPASGQHARNATADGMRDCNAPLCDGCLAEPPISQVPGPDPCQPSTFWQLTDSSLNLAANHRSGWTSSQASNQTGLVALHAWPRGILSSSNKASKKLARHGGKIVAFEDPDLLPQGRDVHLTLLNACRRLRRPRFFPSTRVCPSQHPDAGICPRQHPNQWVQGYIMGRPILAHPPLSIGLNKGFLVLVTLTPLQPACLGSIGVYFQLLRLAPLKSVASNVATLPLILSGRTLNTRLLVQCPSQPALHMLCKMPRLLTHRGLSRMSR